MLKTICQIIFICCIPMLSGKENTGQEYVSYIKNCIELENFERQQYPSIEEKCITNTETLLEAQKELEQLPEEAFCICIENSDLDTSVLAEQLAGCWQQYRMKNQYILSVTYVGEEEKGKESMMPFCGLIEEEGITRLEKELEKKGGFPSYIRLERFNGLDIYTFCIYIPGEKIDEEESYEEEFLIILNGTWEGQEVCWQYVTFPATGSFYSKYKMPYDELAAMKVDVNYDGSKDLLIRENVPYRASHSWEYHSIIWKAELGKFVWYESFPEKLTYLEFDKRRIIYHRDSDSEWGVEYITEYRVINGEYVATRDLAWNSKDEIVFYYEMGVLVKEHPNIGYKEIYGLYPDLDYWWRG